MVDPLGINLNNGPEWFDDVRATFLVDLDNSDVEVTDFESKFIESNLGLDEFTTKQRTVIDSMMKRYEHLI